MAAVTLHKLLWGMPRSRKVSKWPIATHEVPAIGLPTRVAAALLLAACRRSPPKDWGIEQRPLVWQLSNSKRRLAEGRRLQLGCAEPDPHGRPHNKVPTVERSKRWDVPPHPAYYMPLNQGSAVHPANYVLYCDVLLFLTALDGDERILDSLYLRQWLGRRSFRRQVGMAVTNSPDRGDLEGRGQGRAVGYVTREGRDASPWACRLI